MMGRSMGRKRITIADISRNRDTQLLKILEQDLLALPPPYEKSGRPSPVQPLTPEQTARYDVSLDGVAGIQVPKPQKDEEDALVERFLNGLRRLFSMRDNWTFWQQLELSLDICVRCQVCSEACPVYLASGKQEIYRPTWRSEVLRRIKKKYIDPGGRVRAKLFGRDIELNWTAISRLAESSFRCTMCRRCASWCPMGSDNGLITHEIRKLFSQEMNLTSRELHEKGTVQQLGIGASTGLNPKAFQGIVEFMEEEIQERTGKRIRIPIDQEGADILLIHNSGEFMSWMENPEAFAILFDAAGVSWTLSSELGGYEATNYGVWYDDVQLARIALKHSQVARELKVKKIVVGECGHAHKALVVIADRVLTGEANVPRESFLPLLEDLILENKIKLDPKKNDFPVTLHDPCNMVRLMGIVEPQRRILRRVCPQFREMSPRGTDNFCCGGGSGFAIMNSMNFPDWRSSISGRMKLKQILEVFGDVLGPQTGKYVCAPCSNCKGQIRDLFTDFGVWEKSRILYGGLVELVVNAMADRKEPYIQWEWR